MKESLTQDEIKQFIEDGFVKLENCFSDRLAEAGRSILWKDTGCDPSDPTTWTHPVIRLGDYPQEPFRLAANAPLLHAAADQLVGKEGGCLVVVWELSPSVFPANVILAMRGGMQMRAFTEVMVL